MMERPWAFWRRAQYVGVFALIFLVCAGALYGFYFYKTSTCTDGRQNGEERGVDCGGVCERMCIADVTPLTVRWTESFRVMRGQYNAVAYVDNKNTGVGAYGVKYTFSIFDSNNREIATKSGITFIPPNSVYAIFEGRINVGDGIPKRTTITIDPNIEWVKTQSGREDFFVASRTLVDADTEPKLEAVLRNLSLEDVKNVETVATIFDVRGNPLTTSRSIVPLIEGRTDKTVVFTWPEPIAKTIRSCEVPTDVVLGIDLSGSINDDGGTPPQPITSVLKAASSFVSKLRKDDQVGIVTFATRASLANMLTSDKSAISSSVNRLAVSPSEEAGSTNIGDAIAAGTKELTSERHNTDARKVLIILTDGKANAPEEKTAESYALVEAEKAKNAGIEIFTIGLGTKINGEFLTSVASDRTHSVQNATAATIGNIYSSISQALCEEGAAVIDIIPKVLPER